MTSYSSTGSTITKLPSEELLTSLKGDPKRTRESCENEMVCIGEYMGTIVFMQEYVINGYI